MVTGYRPENQDPKTTGIFKPGDWPACEDHVGQNLLRHHVPVSFAAEVYVYGEIICPPNSSIVRRICPS